MQPGTSHLSWPSAQLEGHPWQPRERAGIRLGLVPAFLSRVREVEVALFVEVTEGGAEGPLHRAEQVSMQDEDCPCKIRSVHGSLGCLRLPSRAASTHSSQGIPLLSDGRKLALGNTFAM